MPILAIKSPLHLPSLPPPHLHQPRKERGFSLLEILIVLAILGLVIGITAPRLTVYAQALQFSKKSQGVIYSLKRHRAEAVVHKRARWLVFQDNAPPRPAHSDVDIIALDLPKDWTARGTPLFISAAGHCRGSHEIILSDPVSQRQAAYEILSPDCTAREIKAPLSAAAEKDAAEKDPNETEVNETDGALERLEP